MQAPAIAVRPVDFDHVMHLIQDRMGTYKSVFTPAQVDINENAMTFVSRQPLRVKALGPPPLPGEPKDPNDNFFTVSTQFLLKSPTVEKRVFISQGPNEKARVRFVLRHEAQAYEQFLYRGLGVPVQVYNRAEEMLVYFQTTDVNGTIDMKEWIYARQPNCPQGSRYTWSVKSEEFYRRLVLEPGEKGTVDIQRQVVIKEIDAHDYAKQRHVIDVINRSGLKNFHIEGEDTIGKILPVFYITKEGKRKPAALRLDGRNELTIEINEPAKSYPLLIESD
jgi:hypothetical protein